MLLPAVIIQIHPQTFPFESSIQGRSISLGLGMSLFASRSPAAASLKSRSTFLQAGRTAADASNLARFASLSVFSLPTVSCSSSVSFVFYSLIFKHCVRFSYCIPCLTVRCHQLERWREQLAKTKAHLLHFEQNKSCSGCPCKSLWFLFDSCQS